MPKENHIVAITARVVDPEVVAIDGDYGVFGQTGEGVGDGVGTVIADDGDAAARTDITKCAKGGSAEIEGASDIDTVKVHARSGGAVDVRVEGTATAEGEVTGVDQAGTVAGAERAASRHDDVSDRAAAAKGAAGVDIDRAVEGAAV